MRVLEAKVMGEGRLWVRFSDGFAGEVEIPLAGDDELRAVFERARCNGHTVEWPGGIDYCPDTLRDLAEATARKGAHAAGHPGSARRREKVISFRHARKNSDGSAQFFAMTKRPQSITS